MTDSFLTGTSKGRLGVWVMQPWRWRELCITNRSEGCVETYRFTEFLQCLVCIILGKGNILLPDKLG